MRKLNSRNCSSQGGNPSVITVLDSIVNELHQKETGDEISSKEDTTVEWMAFADMAFQKTIF